MTKIDYRELKIGSVLLVSGQAVQALVAFGVNLVLVRYLKPEEFGRFALALAGVALVYAILSLRINVLIIRSSEARFDAAAQDRYFTAMTLETLVAGAAAFGWLAVTGTADRWAMALIVALGVRHWVHTNTAFFERAMPYRKLALIETGSATAGHLVALGLILTGAGWTTLYIREFFLTAAGLVGLAAVGGLTFRRLRPLSGIEWRQLFGEARGVWLDGVLENSFQRFVILVAGLLGGERTVGFFFQAQRLATVPHQFLAPVLGRVAANWFGRTEDSEARRAGRNRILLAAAGPLAAVSLLGVAFADPLIPWLFGEPWRPAADLFAAMCGMVLFISLFEVLKVYCWSTERTGPLLAGRVVQYLGCLVPVAAINVLALPGGLALSLGLSLAYAGAFVTVLFLLGRREDRAAADGGAGRLIERIGRGGHQRKTRFHDEKGNLVDAGGMRYAPHSLVTAALRVGLGYRPQAPMISYRAARTIAAGLPADAACVEFGSGMSTPWLARHCAYLLSRENDRGWYRKVGSLLKRAGLTHVRYEYREPERFHELPDHPDGFFDFALIDGWNRAGCVASVLPKLKPGGWIYLDNSDKDMTIPDGDLRRAEAALLEAVEKRGGSVEYFVDFSPTNFFVEQGLLARFSR